MLVTIEDTREALYSLLLELGPGYHDRPEIAKRLGKKYLNPVDVAALDMLVSDGRIEKISQPIGKPGRGGNISRWVYRVKDQK